MEGEIAVGIEFEARADLVEELLHPLLGSREDAAVQVALGLDLAFLAREAEEEDGEQAIVFEAIEDELRGVRPVVVAAAAIAAAAAAPAASPVARRVLGAEALDRLQRALPLRDLEEPDVAVEELVVERHRALVVSHDLEFVAARFAEPFAELREVADRRGEADDLQVLGREDQADPPDRAALRIVEEVDRRR